MSLSETLMGINSVALDTPLNHLIWLNDYKTYGEESYVFQNKDILHELYNSIQLSMNDKRLRAEAFDYILSINERVGLALGAIYGSGNIDWSDYPTFESVITLSETLDLLTGKTDLVNVIVKDESRMSQIVENEQLMSFVVDNEVAINTISNSTTLMNKVTMSGMAMNLICKSSMAIKKIDAASIQNYKDNLILACSDKALFSKNEQNGLNCYHSGTRCTGATVCILNYISNSQPGYSSTATGYLNGRTLATVNVSTKKPDAIALGGITFSATSPSYPGSANVTYYTAL